MSECGLEVLLGLQGFYKALPVGLCCLYDIEAGEEFIVVEVVVILDGITNMEDDRLWWHGDRDFIRVMVRHMAMTVLYVLLGWSGFPSFIRARRRATIGRRKTE